MKTILATIFYVIVIVSAFYIVGQEISRTPEEQATWQLKQDAKAAKAKALRLERQEKERLEREQKEAQDRYDKKKERDAKRAKTDACFGLKDKAYSLCRRCAGNLMGDASLSSNLGKIRRGICRNTGRSNVDGRLDGVGCHWIGTCTTDEWGNPITQ